MTKQSPLAVLIAIVVVAGVWAYATGRLDGIVDSAHRIGTPVNPPEEDRLIAVQAEYARQYDNAPNDIVRDRVDGAMLQAMCSALPTRRAENWLATISSVDVTHNGYGIVILTLSRRITLTTNTLEMWGPDGLIPPTSDLPTRLETFTVGGLVRVSGTFRSDAKECLINARFSDIGRIHEPLLSFIPDKMEAVR